MLKDILLKNLGKKLVAFVFALSLWFAANIEQAIERNVSVEITYSNLPDDLTIVNKPPETLTALVRGPRSRLSSVSARDVGLTLDLSQVSIGMSKFEIRTEQLKSPREIQVVGISPAEIKLDIDNLVEKQVAVKPIIGLPDTGYEISGDPESSPSQVTIIGPKRAVSKVESLATDLISTTGVKSKFRIEVPLKSPSKIEIVGENTVLVSVNIKERNVVKEFDDIDISLLNFDGYEIEPLQSLKAELEFEGPYSAIRDLKSNDIKAFIDGGEISGNSDKTVHSLYINVRYPYAKTIKLTKKLPDRVEVRLK